VLSYLVAVTSAVVGAGRLGDAIGRRRLLLAGLGLFTLASLLCAAAPALWLLIVARIAQGLGAAAMMALAMAMAGDAARYGKAGGTMGLLGAASAAGTALGPAAGGALIAVAGWQASFVLCGAGGAGALLLAWRHLPAGRPQAAAAPVPVAGTLLLAAALAGYALAASLGRGSFGWTNVLLLAAAGAALACFVAVERRSAAPLIRPGLLRDAPLARGLAAGALVSTVIMATLVVGPFYLAYGLAQETARVGLIMSAGPITVVLTGIPAGRLADRIGTRRTALSGLILMLVGCSALWLLPTSAGVADYLLGIVVTTAGYSLFQTGNNSFVLERAPANGRGLVSGLLNLFRNLGLITGASAMASIFAAAMAGASPASAPADLVAAAMRTTFAAGTVLILIALALTFPIPGRGNSAAPGP
jgi:MFS family permease